MGAMGTADGTRPNMLRSDASAAAPPGRGNAARSLRHSIVAAVLVALTACGGGGSGPSSSSDPHGSPPPADGGFTPDRERPVGFAAAFWDSSSHHTRVAIDEAARVSAMHRRGGTGGGETVGVFDSGVNPDHEDLRGQYAAQCAMGLCNGAMGSDDDGRPELDRYDHSPLYDTDGHGTSVLGVVAARRNGAGVYGVAYEARIASYGNSAAVPWDDGTCVDCAFGARDHAWGGIFDKQTARGVDWMRSLGVGATNFSWGRTYPWTLDRELTAAYVERIMPHTLPAFRSYVEAGGVAVWGAGNSRSLNPDVEAALPRHFPELEKGWLAAVSLDPDDRIAFYSSECGIAAGWCIAAPGEVVTTRRGGRWEAAAGTSIAAPYVTAGLAALKSMFPNLSYHQVRQRMLTTADRSSPYDDPKVYGQGRLDLDAASRPVGGTNFSIGGLATGPVLSTGGTAVALPREAIARHLTGRTIVVLDGYQRAPFTVGLDAFAAPRSPYLSLDDLAPEPRRQRRDERNGRTALAVTGRDVRGQGSAKGRTFLGIGQGMRAVQGLSHLAGTPLPVGGYRMTRDAAGVALGFAGGSGRWLAVAAAGNAGPGGAGFGISGWSPETVLAASFVPHPAAGAPGAEAFGISFASDMRRPLGWDGSGALGVQGDAIELAWRRTLMHREAISVDLTNRLTHLAVRDGALLRFEDSALAAVDLEVSIRPHRLITVAARLGAERAISPVEGRLRAADAVDENGRIAYREIAIDGRELASFDRAGLVVGYAGEAGASFNLGVAGVRDGYGRTEGIAGFRVDLEF